MFVLTLTYLEDIPLLLRVRLHRAYEVRRRLVQRVDEFIKLSLELRTKSRLLVLHRTATLATTLSETVSSDTRVRGMSISQGDVAVDIRVM